MLHRAGADVIIYDCRFRVNEASRRNPTSVCFLVKENVVVHLVQIRLAIKKINSQKQF